MRSAVVLFPRDSLSRDSGFFAVLLRMAFRGGGHHNMNAVVPGGVQRRLCFWSRVMALKSADGAFCCGFLLELLGWFVRSCS
jgi:hypothetical protein